MSFKLLSLTALLLCAAPLINAAVWNISVADNYFAPATLQIAVGDTVNWNWTGIHPHTVTQGTTVCNTLATGFNSGTLTGIGHSFNQTFTANETVYYVCTVHCASANMVATVTVGSGTPVTTTPAPVTTTTTPRVPVTHTVQVGYNNGLVFSPASLTILQFDSVAFTLASGTHNVQSIPTAGSCTLATNAAIFSGATPLAGTYTVQFNTTGTFPYMCSYHCASGMAGVVNVVTTLPTPTGNGAQAQSAVASILILAIALTVALTQRA